MKEYIKMLSKVLLLIGFMLNIYGFVFNVFLDDFFFLVAIIVSSICFIVDLKSKAIFNLNKVQKVLLLFIISALVSCLLNYQYLNQKTNHAIIELLLIFYLFFFSTNSSGKVKKEYELIIKVFLIVSFIISVITLYIYVFRINVTLFNSMVIIQNGQRVNGMWNNSNTAACNALISIVISLKYIFDKDNIKLYRFSIVNYIIQMYMMTWSYSRSMILAGIIVLIFVINYLYKRDLKILKIIMIITMLVIVSGVGIKRIHSNTLVRDYYVIVENVNKMNDKDNIYRIEYVLNKLTSLRYEIWKSDLIITTQNNPLLGNGLNHMSEIVLNDQHDNSIIIKGNYDNAHNIFVNLYFCTGLIGLSIFSYFIYLQIKRIKTNYKVIQKDTTKLVALGIVFIVFVFSLLDRGIFMPLNMQNIIFWISLNLLNNTD